MNFLDEMLFLLFPKSCEICGKYEKDYICDSCKQKIEKSPLYLNKIDNYGKNKNKYFDEHAYIFKYSEIIRDIIIRYKFRNCPYLSRMFTNFFIKNQKICGFLKKYDIIIPVPMSNKKIRQRGYNQAKIIAKQIANNNKNIIFSGNVLVKCKNNQTQSTLSKIQRLQNVQNVYKVQNKEVITEKNVLIFDDIYTTGATVNECAKILKSCNPKSIGILTIAKDYNKY